MLIVLISPGRAVFSAAATGASGATLPIAVIQSWTLGLLWGDTVGEGVALARRVVGVFVPGALGVEEPIELLLVGGGTLLRPINDSDSVVGAVLAVAGLG